MTAVASGSSGGWRLAAGGERIIARMRLALDGHRQAIGVAGLTSITYGDEHQTGNR
jgi:hypothetical protein